LQEWEERPTDPQILNNKPANELGSVFEHFVRLAAAALIDASFRKAATLSVGKPVIRFDMTLRPAALPFLALCSVVSQAQVPTAHQAISMWRVESPRMSPDGRFVAYQRTVADWKENAFRTQLWIADLQAGTNYALTQAAGSSTAAAWSPDSKRIAFRSDRGGTSQLYVISPTGGEAKALTKVETGIGSFQWAPDGSRIAMTVTDGPDAEQRKRVETLGRFTIVDEEGSRARVAVIAVPENLPDAPAAPTVLTDHEPLHVGSLSWSPDGTRIAFDATPVARFGNWPLTDVYVLDVAARKVRRVVDRPGSDTGPVWSPDGKTLAYTTTDGDPYPFMSNTYVAVVPADGGTPLVVSREFDEQPGLLGWGPQGILFSGTARTSTHLFRLDPSGGAAVPVTAPKSGVFGQFSFDKDFRQTAFVTSESGRFTEVAVSSLTGFSPRILTAASEQAKGFRLATREVVRWKSKDGEEIEGILIKPANFDPSRKYPLLVVIHGGPTAVDLPFSRPDAIYPIERFVDKGAVVLQPNYRGSAGYGKRFRALNVRNLGIGDAWDVLSGCDHLIKQGFVDPTRMGSMGWSQGGYISAFLTATSDRFKAISVGAGISNWVTYYNSTDVTEFTRQYLRATAVDDPEIYAKTSPMTYIKQAKTPTLIQHGQYDLRVPTQNAYELYRALQDRKVPSKLIVYTGFGHGINKPKEALAVNEHNWEWFLQYLWGERPAGGR